MTNSSAPTLGFDIESLTNKGKKRSKHTFEYLKEGVHAYRILPSFNPADRRLEHTYSVHWLTGETGKPMKVLCTYGAERYCPICLAYRETKKTHEHAKLSDPNSENTRQLAESERKLSGSKSIYYNAVNASGEPVVLELNSTASKDLENLIIEAVQKKGFDPTALNGGVWFEFTKKGKGRDSVRVDYRRISKLVNGDMVDVLDRTAFSDELVARLPNAVANIHDPKNLWIKEYTSAQLSDFLRGKPLPVNNSYVGAPTADESQEIRSEASPAPVSVASRTSIPTPVAATSVSTGGKTVEDYRAEAEKLKRLSSNGNG